MNNVQKFIAGEFDYVKAQHPEYDFALPQIRVNFGLTSSKYLNITWEEFEQIKQLLIDSEKDN